MLRAVGVSALLLVIAGCAANAHEERPLVCRVAEDRAMFAGQSVTLEGRLFSDFMHGSGVTHDECLEGLVLFGDPLPGERGGRAFDEAWRVSASCRDDPLYFTVTGVIERTQGNGFTYFALRPSEFRDIRRGEGSDCPITLQQLYERLGGEQ